MKNYTWKEFIKQLLFSTGQPKKSLVVKEIASKILYEPATIYRYAKGSAEPGNERTKALLIVQGINYKINKRLIVWAEKQLSDNGKKLIESQREMLSKRNPK